VGGRGVGVFVGRGVGVGVGVLVGVGVGLGFTTITVFDVVGPAHTWIAGLVEVGPDQTVEERHSARSSFHARQFI